MDAVEINLDGGVFSADTVVRATHRYSADYYTDIASTENGFIVRLTPKSADTDTSVLVHQFRNDALDEQLRERVRVQTQGLHDTLVQAALLKACAQPSDQTP
jgi:His-Xaa-Ser system protein HxsD